MKREKLKVGMIGFGARGTLLLRDIILPLGKADMGYWEQWYIVKVDIIMTFEMK